MTEAGGIDEILSAAAEIFLVFAIAFVLKFLGYCDQDTAKKCIEIVVLFLVPMSLIVYIPRVQFKFEWLVMPIAPLVYIIIALPIQSKVFTWCFRGISRHDRGQLLLCCTGHAVTLVGFPIVRGIYGESALALCAAWDLVGFMIAYFATYIVAAAYAPEKSGQPKRHIFHHVRHVVAKAPHHFKRENGAVFMDPVLRGHGARRLAHAKTGLTDDFTRSVLARRGTVGMVARQMTGRVASPTVNDAKASGTLNTISEGEVSLDVGIESIAPDEATVRTPRGSLPLHVNELHAHNSAGNGASDATLVSTKSSVASDKETSPDPALQGNDAGLRWSAGASSSSSGACDSKVENDLSETRNSMDGGLADCREVLFGFAFLLGKVFMKVIKMLVTLAFLSGLVMRLFSITSDDFPTIIAGVVHKSAACSQIVTIFGLGLVFQPELLLQTRYTKRLFVLIVCKYTLGVVVGLLFFVAMRDVDELIPSVLCIAMIMPTPPVVIAYAGEHKYDVSFAALVVNATLLTSFLLAFAMALILPLLR